MQSQGQFKLSPCLKVTLSVIFLLVVVGIACISIVVPNDLNTPTFGNSTPTTPMLNASSFSNFPAYKLAEKGLYVWSDTAQSKVNGTAAWTRLISNTNGSFDKLVNFAKLHNFSNVNLFAGSCEWEWEASFSKGNFPVQEQLVQRLNQLKTNNISANLVVYINDGVDDLNNSERLLDVARAASNLKTAGHTFSLHVDQEPKDVTKLEQLADVLNRTNAIFPTGTTLKPGWISLAISSIGFSDAFRQNIAENVTTFAELLMSVTSSTELMDYSNDILVIENRAVTYFGSIAKMKATGHLILETGITGAAVDETLGQMVQGNTNYFFSFVTQLQSQYQMIVIHDYRQYFTIFYNSEPLAYSGNI